MTYSETVKTEGNYRVRLVIDEDADAPYDDGAAPIMRLDYYRGGGWRAAHVDQGNRPRDCDDRIEEAAQRWGSDFDLLEKYLRAYHGTTKVQTWHSGEYWYITYDSAVWRDYTGAPVDAIVGEDLMAEYRAYVEGDVWGYVVEKRVTWHTDEPVADIDRPGGTYADRDSWEHVDSCWGFYGQDYAREAAAEALAAAKSDD
jgi:hypothetical protein